MEPARPPRWRGRDARRRADARHMLAFGGIVGIVAGIVLQPLIGTPHGDLAWLVRVSLLLPAAIYLAWWLIDPGWAAAERRVDHAAPTIDADERIERIESLFDSAAVPRARRERLQTADTTQALVYRSSVRPDRSDTIDPQSFGLHRSPQIGRDADTR